MLRDKWYHYPPSQSLISLHYVYIWEQWNIILVAVFEPSRHLLIYCGQISIFEPSSGQVVSHTTTQWYRRCPVVPAQPVVQVSSQLATRYINICTVYECAQMLHWQEVPVLLSSYLRKFFSRWPKLLNTEIKGFKFLSIVSY